MTWHDMTWHDMTWHDITLHYITLHTYTQTYTHTYIHYITLHYITLHCLTLHYITLHTHTHTYIHTYIHTGFLKRQQSSYMLSNHTWSTHMLLPNACRHPNRNGLFFKGLSKQSDVTTLHGGEGGMQVSSQWLWQDGCYSWRTRTQRESFFWLMDVQTQAWTNSLLHLPKTTIKTHFHLHSC